LESYLSSVSLLVEDRSGICQESPGWEHLAKPENEVEGEKIATRAFGSRRHPGPSSHHLIWIQFQRRKILVNAAFLLMTAAWVSGADAAPAAPAAAPTAAAPAATATAPAPAATVILPGQPGAPMFSHAPGGFCGSGCCDAAPEEPKKGFCARLKEMCKRKPKEEPCDTCNPCGPAPMPMPAPAVVAAPACGCGDCCAPAEEPKKGFCARLKEMCKRKPKEEAAPCCDGGWAAPYGHINAIPAPGTIITPGTTPPAGEKIGNPKEEPANPMPKGGAGLMPPAVDLAPSTTKVIEPETKHPFELCRRYESRVERAPDYSWLTGQLFYVHADGGLWVLRYAPVGHEDSNGGGVILARDLQMDSYREGDLVTVHGEVLVEKGSHALGAPLYRAQTIQLVDRGQ
jgi:hypothetical protein